MHLVLVRHGEQDYTVTEGRGFPGPARELAPLTERGVTQVEAVAKDPRLQGCQLIVSSPYTRALQTPATSARGLDLPIEVAFDIHEWLIATPYKHRDFTDTLAPIEEASRFKGVRTPEAKLNWDGYNQVARRAASALLPYLAYEKIIVVTHGYVMKQFYNPGRIPYCGIVEVDFDENFTWPGYIERGTAKEPR